MGTVVWFVILAAVFVAVFIGTNLLVENVFVQFVGATSAVGLVYSMGMRRYGKV